jgi:hypothetical protein
MPGQASRKRQGCVRWVREPRRQGSHTSQKHKWKEGAPPNRITATRDVVSVSTRGEHFCSGRSVDRSSSAKILRVRATYY